MLNALQKRMNRAASFDALMVVRVTARPGRQVQIGHAVLVLEAMKMETDITAPVAVKIKSITVRVGDSVQGGQVLAEFE
jgi:biotin carboxyl carrier protein